MLAVTAHTQQGVYTLNLETRVTAGERYSVAADATINDNIDFLQNNVPGYAESYERVLALVGQLAVDEVTDQGRLKSASLTLSRLEGSINSDALVEVPEQAVIQIQIVAGKPELSVDASSADAPQWFEEWRPLLVLLLDLDTTTVSISEVFKPDRPQSVGQTWSADKQAMLERFTETGLSIPSLESIPRADAKLLRVTDMSGTPVAQIQMVTVLDGAQPAAAAQESSVQLTQSTMTVTRDRISGLNGLGLPLQSTFDLLSESQYQNDGGVETRRKTKVHRVVQWRKLTDGQAR